MTIDVFRLYGGDAARQRAESYAAEHGWTVAVLGDELPFDLFDLDPWGFAAGPNRLRYSHVAYKGKTP